jgi:hypothetical protein
MKYSPYYFVLLLLLGVVSVSCSQKNKEPEIDKILREVSAINAATHLKEVTLEAEDFLANQPDNGGELLGLFEERAIRKISLWVGLSNGFETKDYYFKNDRLIFVHEQFNSVVYDMEREAFDLGKTEKTFNGRYFFEDGQLLNYETTGHNRFEDDAMDPEASLLTEAKEYAAILKSKQ